MGIFNFSNDTQNQIASDVNYVNRIMIDIINIADSYSSSLPYNVSIRSRPYFIPSFS